MGLFGSDKEEGTVSLADARRAAGHDEPDAVAGLGGSAVAQARADAQGTGPAAGKKPRKGRADTGKSRGAVPADDDKLRKEFADLMSLDTFKALVRFPADVGLIITGREHFNLDDKRVEPVARQGQICASYWMAVDPKYLSLAAFGLGMAALYAGVIAKELAFRRQPVADDGTNDAGA